MSRGLSRGTAVVWAADSPPCSPSRSPSRSRAPPGRARSGCRSATRSTTAARRLERSRPSCGGSATGGRSRTAACTAAGCGSTPATIACSTTGARPLGSPCRRRWRRPPCAPPGWTGCRSRRRRATNPAYLVVRSAGTRVIEAPTGSGTSPGTADRRSLPAGARDLELVTWCSPANGPGWCNWYDHLLELRGLTLELEEHEEPAVEASGELLGGGPRRGVQPLVVQASDRDSGDPARRRRPRRHAGRCRRRRARVPRRPPAAVPARVAPVGRRRHRAGGRRRPPAAPGRDGRGRQRPHGRRGDDRGAQPAAAGRLRATAGRPVHGPAACRPATRWPAAGGCRRRRRARALPAQPARRPRPRAQRHQRRVRRRG